MDNSGRLTQIIRDRDSTTSECVVADRLRRCEELTPEPQPIGGFHRESDSTTAQTVSAGPSSSEFPINVRPGFPGPAHISFLLAVFLPLLPDGPSENLSRKLAHVR
jgi:hypothetical protein